MSLILDALKRAERERQADGPALADLPSPSAQPRRRFPWRLVLAVFAMAIVGAVAWKRTHRAPATIAARAVPAPAPKHQQPSVSAPGFVPAPLPTPSPAPGPGPILARPPMQSAPAVIPGTEGVSSLDELAQDEEPPPVPATSPTPAAPEKPATKPAPAAQAAAPLPEEPIVEEPAAPLEPEAKTVEPPPRELPPALTQPARMRTLREMPPEYRADFPALTIQVHVYEQIPSQRFAIVNDRRYRQGETMVEGPLLVEIAREGLVLDYRGERVLFTLGR